jgi:hypothetical protein
MAMLPYMDVIGEHFIRFWGRRNYPQDRGTRPTTGSSFDVVPTLATPRPWFACARLRDPYLTRSCHAISSPLTTRALDPRSVRWFAASSCKAAARGLPSSCVQQGCLRVLRSYALLRAVVAHSHRHIDSSEVFCSSHHWGLLRDIVAFPSVIP